jgi:hypothetical protein
VLTKALDSCFQKRKFFIDSWRSVAINNKI